MPDRSSMLKDTGDSSQFFIWGMVSLFFHIMIFAGMFFLPELNIPDPQPKVITIDLAAIPSPLPPVIKKGIPDPSLKSAKKGSEGPAGLPAEKDVPPAKGDGIPPKPEPKPKEVKEPEEKKKVEHPKEKAKPEPEPKPEPKQ